MISTMTTIHKTSRREAHGTQRLWTEVEAGRYGVLDARILTDAEVKNLADKIKKTASFGVIYHFIDKIPGYGRRYDWNVGNILRHFDADLVVNSLRHAADARSLYDSVGLAWVLGEYRDRDPFIVDRLYAVVREAGDFNAWWQAAFSLEKLGVDDAVNLLKRSFKPTGLKDLNFYLERLADKRSLIGILLRSDQENIRTVLYPRIRKIFLKGGSRDVVINSSWLIGRLKLMDDEIMAKLVALTRHEDYELKYYAFFALQNNASERLRPVFEKALRDKDRLARMLAARGLRSIGSERSLVPLEEALYLEKEEPVILEISKTVYRLKNPSSRERLLIKLRSCKNENGMVSDADDEDRDPSLYDKFAEAQDPENVCFGLILRKIGEKKIMNPIDLAAGTGRTLLQILEHVRFEGELCGVDSSAAMCAFAEEKIRRSQNFMHRTKIARSTIADFPKKNAAKSNFIVSSFGFPSRRSDARNCLRELKAVHDLLADDGEFYTIGGDETFNDELSMMWFKYIPDDIHVRDFEEWRERRMAMTMSPRNCDLTWFKRGLRIPLQFGSLKESAQVMGYLFGRDAAQYAIRQGKTEWVMSLGITCDTKKDIGKIIKTMERGS